MPELIVPANLRLRKIVLYWSTLGCCRVCILALETYLEHVPVAGIV